MVVSLVLLYNSVRPIFKWLWIAGIAVIICSSLLFGVYIQASVYKGFFAYAAGLQSYAPLFDWLSEKKEECVILVAGNQKQKVAELPNLLLGFTPCDSYGLSWGYTIMPNERIFHNLMVYLRLKGITPETVSNYLKDNRREVNTYLYSNWKGMYESTDFPDFSDTLLKERIKKFPADYSDFFKSDFKSQLAKYRLDYILLAGSPNEEIAKVLGEAKPVFKLQELQLYRFR